ncbi:MAG: ATP-binding protein, partial [Chloroflexota bacterium]|nr:ATP-binding protein [Chloroflexota bacterium]
MRLAGRAQAWLWLTVLAAAGVLVASFGAGLEILTADPTRARLAATLLALAVVAQHFPLLLAPGYKINMAVAVYFATVVLLDTAGAVLLVATSHLAGGVTLAVRQRVPSGKRLSTVRSVLFNTGQVVLTVALGAAVYTALLARAAPVPLVRAEDLWALPLAALAMYLANTLAVAIMVGLQRDRHPLAVWRDGQRSDLPQFAALYLIGAVGAVSAVEQAWVLPVMALPTGVIYLSLKRTLQYREAAETAEREYHEKVALLDSTREGIYGLDLQGRCTFINPAAMTMLGQATAEVLRAPMHGLIHPGCSGRVADWVCPVLDATEGARSVHLPDILLWRADGSSFSAEYSAAPVMDAGEVVGMVVTFTDLTERKRVRDEVIETNEALRRALTDLETAQQQVIQQERLRALGEMASGIAHDFNNALSPVVGFSELLLLKPELNKEPNTRRYLEMISVGAQDATRIVDRLKEFYRHREKDGDLFRSVDLAALARLAVALTQPRWKDQAQASGRTIELRTDLQAVPPVAGDDAALREVLVNLIFNAVDALATGGIITVETREVSAQVILEVSDTGAGMTEEVRRRCLEPFFTTKGERGSGMGLSMVHGIVRRHEGTLAIDSALGAGTTIRIAFPILTRPDEALAAPAPVPVASGLRVLVVDDDRGAREATVALLIADGYAVDEAADAQQGLRVFRAGGIDVVITDRAMPDMNGDRLAEAIKALAPATPVLLL